MIRGDGGIEERSRGRHLLPDTPLRAHQKVKIFCNEGSWGQAWGPKNTNFALSKAHEDSRLGGYINYTARFAKGNYEELYGPPSSGNLGPV